jgi:hypothetical protein
MAVTVLGVLTVLVVLANRFLALGMVLDLVADTGSPDGIDHIHILHVFTRDQSCQNSRRLTL